MAHTESWPTFRTVVKGATAPSWVDLHNVLGRDVRGERARWADVEREIVQIATIVSVCSEQERTRLLLQQPDTHAEVTVMTHGVDPAEWLTPRVQAADPVVKLFGNWAWEPNARGLDWFLKEVWPAVDVPGARCEIAGTGVSLDERTAPRVTFVGRVPFLDKWTSDAWVVAVPVVGGVGAPVKYLEALATGAPVVSTTAGAPTAQGSATLVSDDPQEWIKVLRQLLATPTPSQRPRVTAEDFSWESATTPLLRWLEDR